MKSKKASVLVIAATGALLLSLWAQQPNNTNSQQMPGMQPGQTMQDEQKTSKQNRMQNCRKNMQSMMQSNDQVKKDIEAAKESNDPAKMRAALDEAEKALDSLNGHMNDCMKMMGKGQNIGGMSGKMCGALMSAHQSDDQAEN